MKGLGGGPPNAKTCSTKPDLFEGKDTILALHLDDCPQRFFFTPYGCFFSQHNEFSKLYFILSWAKTTSLKPNRVMFSDYFL